MSYFKLHLCKNNQVLTKLKFNLFLAALAYYLKQKNLQNLIIFNFYFHKNYKKTSYQN